MLAAHPLELVDAAAAGGFDYCGLRLVSPTSTDADSLIDVVGNPPLKRDIAARLDETGVRLLDIEAIWLQASTRVSELEAAIAAGSRLGASRVLAVGFDADKGRQLDSLYCGERGLMVKPVSVSLRRTICRRLISAEVARCVAISTSRPSSASRSISVCV